MSEQRANEGSKPKLWKWVRIPLIILLGAVLLLNLLWFGWRHIAYSRYDGGMTMFQAMRDALAEQKQNPLSIDDVAAMVAGQIGQLTPMDEETADLFKQLAKKMMKGIE